MHYHVHEACSRLFLILTETYPQIFLKNKFLKVTLISNPKALEKTQPIKTFPNKNLPEIRFLLETSKFPFIAVIELAKGKLL